jgi:metal transporter CNNM
LESKSSVPLACKTVFNINREIIDESDVFIDVHKAIRRMAPAPRARVPRGKVVTDVAKKSSDQPLIDVEEDTQPNGNGNGNAQRKLSLPETSETAPLTSFLVRRRSSGQKNEPLRSNDPQLYEHLKHLGPSNAANRPKSTRINTVKIKPGNPTIPQTIPENERPARVETPPAGVVSQESHAPEGGVGEGLLTSAGREASDGVHSVAVGYGTIAAPTGDRMSWKSSRSFRESNDEPRSPKYTTNDNNEEMVIVDNRHQDDVPQPRSRSVSTIASLRSTRSRSKSPPARRHTARSGSISENVVDVNGIKKIVLETTSSSDSDDKTLLVAQADGAEDSKGQSEAESANAGGKGGNKKKRKKRGKKKKGNAGEGSESQPLLGEK